MESIADFPVTIRVMRDSVRVGLVLLSLRAVTGCATATVEPIAPPSANLRQQINTVELRVMTKSAPNWRATDSLKTDPEYQANQRTNADAETLGDGYDAIVFGCDPSWNYLLMLTCPGAMVVGLGMAIADTVEAGDYGAATAHNQDDVKAATASLDRSLLETRIADELRGRLVSTIRESTSIEVLSDDTSREDTKAKVGDRSSVIVFALDIERFTMIREGQDSPDLRLEFTVTGAIYEFPRFHPRYERRWHLYSNLGDFYSLTDSGAIGLRQELDDAFDKMAATIVDDIFVTQASTQWSSGTVVGDSVVTLYGFEQSPVAESSSTTIPSGTLGSYIRYQAAHGNVDAAIHLVRETERRKYADYVPLSSDRLADRSAWRSLCEAANEGFIGAQLDIALWHRPPMWASMDSAKRQLLRSKIGIQPDNRLSYMWYMLAEQAGSEEAVWQLGQFKNNMTPDEIAEAEQMVRDWKPGDCPSAEHRLEAAGET
jgi:hypothetical protein